MQARDLILHPLLVSYAERIKIYGIDASVPCTANIGDKVVANHNRFVKINVVDLPRVFENLL